LGNTASIAANGNILNAWDEEATYGDSNPGPIFNSSVLSLIASDMTNFGSVGDYTCSTGFSVTDNI